MASPASDSESDQEWEGWEEGAEAEVRDLFSEATFPHAAALWQHIKTAHGFDFREFCRAHRT